MLKIPQPPRKPNYDLIIANELNKFGNVKIDAKNIKNHLIKGSALCPENPGYVDSVIENIIATIITKMESEHRDYLRKLDAYERELMECKTVLEKQF